MCLEKQEVEVKYIGLTFQHVRPECVYLYTYINMYIYIYIYTGTLKDDLVTPFE